MREILFRGKRVDNGEWLEGNLIVTHYAVGSSAYSISGQITGEQAFYQKVDPATVGQYTGLNDKNGRRIFEGDVVTFDGGRTMQHIRFCDGTYDLIKKNEFYDWLDGLTGPHCEVISNIHDNPELVEESKNQK